MSAIALYQKSISRAVFKGEWHKAVQLLSTMRQRNLYDTKSTNIVMDALVRTGKHDQARALLHMLPKPDEASYSIIMRISSWQGAVALLQDMHAHALMPNVQCYSAAISACESEQWQLALQILGTMEDNRVQPNTVTYNAVISACETQWIVALGLLSHMVVHQSADVISYSAAIHACAHGRQWQKAVAILYSMQDVVPNLLCYNTALSACARAARWEVALRIFEDMPATRDTISYNSLLEALPTDECAKLVYKDGVQRGFYTGMKPPRADFHALSVRVACVALRVFVEEVRASRARTKCLIIMGRGKRSAGGVAKLRPALWQELHACGLQPRRVSYNPGCFRVII